MPDTYGSERDTYGPGGKHEAKKMMPVDDKIKKRISRNFQRGRFGSARGRTRGFRHSVDVGYISVTSENLATVNPHSISTIGNGAWCFNHTPDLWYEKYVPKPNPNETTCEWVDRIGARQWFDDDYDGCVPHDIVVAAAVERVNAHYAQLQGDDT